MRSSPEKTLDITRKNGKQFHPACKWTPAGSIQENGNIFDQHIVRKWHTSVSKC